MKLTRRELAGAIAAAPASLAQAQPAPAPDEELKAARDRLRSNGAALAKQETPMSTEPAFQFKA